VEFASRRRGPVAYVRVLADGTGPVVAVTDFMGRPDQVARWVSARRLARHRRLRPQRHSRAAPRFFEVDEGHVVVATLTQLAAAGAVPSDRIADALRRYEIDPEAAEPWSG
jgi:pyruvate dehydrogenase E1 component